jgi:hypothetical protein
MNELACAAELMKPTTVERQGVPSGRFASAESRVRPTPTEKGRVAAPSQTRVVLQVILIIVGVALGFWALHRLASVVLVLIVAALFAYVIAPLVQLAERPIRHAGRPRHLSRVAAIALVYVLMAASVSGGAVLLLPSATEQVNDMIVRAPSYAQSILAWEHSWSRYSSVCGSRSSCGRPSIDPCSPRARPVSNRFEGRCWRLWALSRTCPGSS